MTLQSWKVFARSLRLVVSRLCSEEAQDSRRESSERNMEAQEESLLPLKHFPYFIY